jgi:hypothetical protein
MSMICFWGLLLGYLIPPLYLHWCRRSKPVVGKKVGSRVPFREQKGAVVVEKDDGSLLRCLSGCDYDLLMSPPFHEAHRPRSNISRTCKFYRC